jgi:hypothetical protein
MYMICGFTAEDDDCPHAASADPQLAADRRSTRKRRGRAIAIILGSMDKLFESCVALEELHVRYGVLVNREVAVTVTVAAPDQYLEIEFFADGSMEIERFVSQGVAEAREPEREAIIQAFRS